MDPSTHAPAAVAPVPHRWHQWLDPVAYAHRVHRIEALAPLAVATARPVLPGRALGDAFSRVRATAGRPSAAPPGRELLDEPAASVLAAAA